MPKCRKNNYRKLFCSLLYHIIYLTVYIVLCDLNFNICLRISLCNVSTCNTRQILALAGNKVLYLSYFAFGGTRAERLWLGGGCYYNTIMNGSLSEMVYTLCCMFNVYPNAPEKVISQKSSLTLLRRYIPVMHCIKGKKAYNQVTAPKLVIRYFLFTF